ncbi:MAG TPA: chromosome segregation protein SMC [Verrucomicrobiae bacterium]|jgi:chromosome segregation protein|nr:chromosome segregation protein SMC [Verrucomicrobiae bacterium]
MRLKRLEMHGFKSFAQRTVVEFPRGVTAIVGPNGCGKSNVVDALRWVMGEQSARHLRGHQMEDVIFNGSDSLAQTGMAEVSLVLENEDGRGPVEYSGFSEIMITRRLFRSGESEYQINKVASRLKDIIELFLGTGVGSKAYSIVEQGRVDELVNAKPEERRVIIEEAAGTSKYKGRKQIAERKLERTQQNLLRVSDIVREIERQIRSMELQAKKAERYRAIKQDLRQKELAWANGQRRALETEIAAHEAALKEAEDSLIEITASLNAKESEAESVRLSLMESDRAISQAQETVYQRKVAIQGDEQKIEFLKKERAGLDEDEARASAQVAEAGRKLTALTSEIEELKKAREHFVQLSLFEEALLKDKESELENLKQRIRAVETSVEEDKSALIELANRAAHARNELAGEEKERAEIENDLTRSRSDDAAAATALDTWREKLRERQATGASTAERASDVAEKNRTLTESIRSWSAARDEQQNRIELLRGKVQETSSRLASLQTLQRNYEGYQQGVRSIMLRRQNESTSNGIYGLVAEVIEAPEAYEKALTAVLGDRLQYVIVKSHEEGLEAIDYLKRESVGRGSFIPREVSRREKKALPLGQPEVVAPMMEVVSVKDDYKAIAEYLLANVVMVRDLKSGLTLWNRNGFTCTLVTPEGEVIDPSGVVTGGSLDGLEGSLLAQRRQIKELEAFITEFQEELRKEEISAGELKSRIAAAEANRSQLVEEGHRLEIDRVRLDHELLEAEQKVRHLEETRQAIAEEAKHFVERLQSIGETIASRSGDIERWTVERSERETTLAENQRSLAELEINFERLDAEATASRIRGATLSEKKDHTHIDLENRLKVHDELSRQLEGAEAEISAVKQKRDEIGAQLAAAESSVEEGKKALGTLETDLERERLKYREISRGLIELEESVKELRPVGQRRQEEKNQLLITLSEERLNLQHLFDGIREKYDCDLREMTPDDAATELSDDLKIDIDELKARLDRMGEVNLAAIGEFEELTSRFQFLSQQKQDLEKSIADLQQTISKLNRVCRLRFKESFEEINQKFEEIFPRLFRGGRAKLVLTDENDYLETGIEIVVQPPGKKLQSITLLSGGEKALTAVSLLFAIFLTKPSPFCFLDEVDAPLDDANLDRFNEMIKEMSSFSQFTVITHNKRTMQAAEVLYGITMEEPGVSKVVSVNMS